MPARIAIMLPRFSQYGGVEQFGYRLAKELAGRGHAVDFICARQETEAPNGVQVFPVGRFGWLKIFKMLWFLMRAEQLRKQGNYDLSISLGKTWNQDLIRVGGGPLRIFWEKSERALEPGLPLWIKRITRWLSPDNWLTLAIERHQFTRNSQVIAVSDLVREWLLQAHPALNPGRVRVIYNRPDITRFAPPNEEKRTSVRSGLWQKVSSSPLPEEPVLFMGTASTNFQLKGIRPLIKTLPLLPSYVHLFIAGGRGTGEYHALAQSQGVAHRVHFCGKVSDMPAFMQALDIFVLPTFYDACSNAVLEALATGCRVLTSRVNGSAFFLPEAHVINDPGNVEAMAAQIAATLADPPPAPFRWPTTISSGLDAFVAAVEESLTK